jgi:hypothetical protein
MEELKFDTSITAKIFHSAKKALQEYVGNNIPEWGRMHHTELNQIVDRVELCLKGKSILEENPTSVELVEEKLLKAISSALLEQEKPVPAKKEVAPVAEVKEEVKVEAPKKAPAKKKK